MKSDRGNIMKNEIKFYENMLTINDVVKEFSTKILQVIEFKNFIVISCHRAPRPQNQPHPGRNLPLRRG